MASVYSFVSEDDGLITKTVNGFLPATAIVPFRRYVDEDVEVLVKEGDVVKEGQIIARSNYSTVHSSIPGKVIEFVHCLLADGSEGYAAKIALKGSFEFTGKKITPADWKHFDAKTIIEKLKDNGVLNTFGPVIPLNIQIENLDAKSNGILAVRLYSEDPSRITENFITDHYFNMIKTGAEIVAKAMNAKGILLAADSNKPLPEVVYEDFKGETGVISLDAKAYPNGFMHEIAKEAKDKLKNTIFRKIGNRDLYIEAQTALNVYNAVVLNKPVIDVNVHVTGDCLNAAAVMNVKIGTTLGELSKQSGDFKRKPGKIVINGLVTGNSLASLDIPVSKEIKSVAFIPFDQLPDQKQEVCIRCGNCVKICPVGLYPESLFRCSLNNNDDDDHLAIIKQTAVLCTECSLCNSVCPSRIPLSQIIAGLKPGKTNEK